MHVYSRNQKEEKVNALRIFIVEDEPLITLSIKISLKKRQIKVVGEADSFNTALEGIEKAKPNLVLLDIQLKGSKDGIDLARELDKKNMAYLYLTSQSDPATISRVTATKPQGYIVKPFTEASLLSNIDLTWHRISLSQKDFITIKVNGHQTQINQANIQFLKAFDNYCYIHTATKNYLVPHTLKNIAASLNQKHFIQVHRSYWVNCRKVQGVGSKTITVDDQEVPVTVTFKQALTNKLSEE